MKIFLLALATLLNLSANADPLNHSLELGTSISGNYGARNVHSNPAALAFENELNGFGFSNYFSYGVNRGLPNEFSTGLTLGNFGLGWESLSRAEGKFQRINFAGASAIGSYLFLGGRLGLQRSESAAIGTFESFDLGLQVRPSPYFSFGLVAARLNQPVVLGVSQASQWIVGTTLRPFRSLDINFDADTDSKDFGKVWGYQLAATTTVAPGLKVRAGYHKDYQWQLGLQWDLGNLSVFSNGHPSSDDRRLVSGFSLSTRPSPSLVDPLAILKIQVDDSLSDEGREGNLFVESRPSLWSLIQAIDSATKKKVSAIHLNIQSFPLGLASAQDLFDALARAREKDIPIEAFLGNAGIKEYLIASAAHRIHMEKSGTLATLGLKVENYYVRGTLDKIGIEPEFLARGEYKSAPDSFLLKKSSEQYRKTILEELKEAETQLLPLLTRYRRIDNAKWKSMLTQALFPAEDALAAGLVDRVGSEEEFRQLNQNQRVVRYSTKTQSDALSLPRRIAIVHASGDILQDRIGFLSLAGRRAITPQAMENRLQAALNDSRTDAILLRINSGGGEILASEQIANLLERAKKEKPLVVSMGDAAASGGYFIAATGNQIFAQPLTMTGSIGVFLGKFSFQGLYRWLNLTKEIFSEAPYPSLFSEHKPWSEAEKSILRRRMNAYYESFVTYVAQKRHLSAQAAEAAAKGRVWLGASAKTKGLVDDLGGYHAAVLATAKAADLGEDFEVRELQDSPSLLNALGLSGWGASLSGLGLSGWGASLSLKEALHLLSPKAAKELIWLPAIQENPFLYRSAIEAQYE